jgi:hypothetical protein
VTVAGGETSAAYDAFAPESDYEAWGRETLAHARRHGLRGDRLLDLACGTGMSFMPFLAAAEATCTCSAPPRVRTCASSSPTRRRRALLQALDGTRTEEQLEHEFGAERVGEALPCLRRPSCCRVCGGGAAAT